MNKGEKFQTDDYHMNAAIYIYNGKKCHKKTTIILISKYLFFNEA